MNDAVIQDVPEIYSDLKAKSEAIGFNMPSDLLVGAMLKTLISSKPKAKVLELGTGIGLSLSWMVDGLDADATIISVDNDPELIAIAQHYFGKDKRVALICADGLEWIKNYKGKKFDLIFADTWPGKYSGIDETLELLKVGGFYVVDDMSQQPNWPEGHQHNVDGLLTYLEAKKNVNLVKMNWSTGLVIVVKKD